MNNYLHKNVIYILECVQRHSDFWATHVTKTQLDLIIEFDDLSVLIDS